jgi:hypothetical protein
MTHLMKMFAAAYVSGAVAIGLFGISTLVTGSGTYESQHV